MKLRFLPAACCTAEFNHLSNASSKSQCLQQCAFAFLLQVCPRTFTCISWGFYGRHKADISPVAFVLLLVISSSLGLLPHSSLPTSPVTAPPHSDKALHFVSFFLLTATFYFILDTSRRRILHLTLVICTLVLGVGSEVLQGLLPNGRDFDAWDVLANVLGSLSAVGIAGWFHRRSADRRRRAKYASLASAEGEEDLELGEGGGALGTSGANGSLEGQETGLVPAVVAPAHKSVEEEVDNWDEHAEDDAWDEDEDAVVHGQASKITPATSSVVSEDVPKKMAVD